MELSFKPNLDEALERWRALWNQEIIGRPCVAVTAPKEGVERVPGPQMQIHPDTDFAEHLDQAEAAMACRYYGGEAMPVFQPSFGPDMFAGFLGADLARSPDSSGTSWSMPTVEDWADVLPLRFDSQNRIK